MNIIKWPQNVPHCGVQLSGRAPPSMRKARSSVSALKKKEKEKKMFHMQLETYSDGNKIGCLLPHVPLCSCSGNTEQVFVLASRWVVYGVIVGFLENDNKKGF